MAKTLSNERQQKKMKNMSMMKAAKRFKSKQKAQANKKWRKMK